MLDNLSDCLICAPEKLQVPLMEFKPMTSMALVQCCNKLNYEATQLWTVQLVGLMCSWERNDKWEKCWCSVVERWINLLIDCKLTNSHLSGFIDFIHYTSIAEVMSSNPIEDTWNFSGAHETITHIFKQVWGSFLKFISPPNSVTFLSELVLFLFHHIWVFEQQTVDVKWCYCSLAKWAY